MIVERIYTSGDRDTGGSSHIEPPFDESWPPLTKLQWSAAVACVDGNLEPEQIHVGEARVARIVRSRWRKREREIPIDGLYELFYRPRSWTGRKGYAGVACSYTYREMHVLLHGISMGADIATKVGL